MNFQQVLQTECITDEPYAFQVLFRSLENTSSETAEIPRYLESFSSGIHETADEPEGGVLAPVMTCSGVERIWNGGGRSVLVQREPIFPG